MKQSTPASTSFVLGISDTLQKNLQGHSDNAEIEMVSIELLEIAKQKNVYSFTSKMQDYYQVYGTLLQKHLNTLIDIFTATLNSAPHLYSNIIDSYEKLSNRQREDFAHINQIKINIAYAFLYYLSEKAEDSAQFEKIESFFLQVIYHEIHYKIFLLDKQSQLSAPKESTSYDTYLEYIFISNIVVKTMEKYPSILIQKLKTQDSQTAEFAVIRFTYIITNILCLLKRYGDVYLNQYIVTSFLNFTRIGESHVPELVNTFKTVSNQTMKVAELNANIVILSSQFKQLHRLCGIKFMLKQDSGKKGSLAFVEYDPKETISWNINLIMIFLTSQFQDNTQCISMTAESIHALSTTLKHIITAINNDTPTKESPYLESLIKFLDFKINNAICHSYHMGLLNKPIGIYHASEQEKINIEKQVQKKIEAKIEQGVMQTLYETKEKYRETLNKRLLAYSNELTSSTQALNAVYESAKTERAADIESANQQEIERMHQTLEEKKAMLLRNRTSELAAELNLKKQKLTDEYETKKQRVSESKNHEIKLLNQEYQQAYETAQQKTDSFIKKIDKKQSDLIQKTTEKITNDISAFQQHIPKQIPNLIAVGKVQLPPEVIIILSLLENKGVEAYVFGGALRDAYLKKPESDWDIRVNCTASHFRSMFPEAYSNAKREGHFIIGKIDLWCEKFEKLQDATDKLDFDCNRFIAGLDEIIKIETKARKTIVQRVMSTGRISTAESFDIDPSRMLRILRIAAEINFTIKSEDKLIIQQKAHLLRDVSLGIWLKNIEKIFNSTSCLKILSMIFELKIYHNVFPVETDLTPDLMHFWNAYLKSAQQKTNAWTAYRVVAFMCILPQLVSHGFKDTQPMQEAFVQFFSKFSDQNKPNYSAITGSYDMHQFMSHLLYEFDVFQTNTKPNSIKPKK